MHKRPQPVKLWYWGPFFRHEAPQAGRFRQFTQIGAEALGSDDPVARRRADRCCSRSCSSAAGARGLRLRLSSLGTPETRARVLRGAARLPARARGRALATRCAARIDRTRCARSTPTDAGHAGGDGGRAALLDRLDAEDAEHFARGAGAARRRRASSTRSTRRSCAASTTTRARCSSSRATRSAPSRGVGGGGRYDGLVEQLGGPPTPGVGWAAGVERILLAAGEPRSRDARGADVFVACPRRAARARRSRCGASCAHDGSARRWSRPGRSHQGPAQAGGPRSARAWSVIVEDDGFEVKDMETGEQRPVAVAEEACCRGASGEAAAPEPLPRPLGRRAARGRRRRASCASPAGSTAGATTAG